MLPKINRVKSKKDFEIIFKEGSSFKNNLMVLKVFKNSLSQSRLGIVTSLKVSKKAIVRNKARRRISEIIKGEFANIKNGTDMVFILLPAIGKKEFVEIKEAVRDVLIKAKIIKNV